MRSSRILTIIAALFVGAGVLAAQSASPTPPKPKSKKESDAVRAMYAAQTPDDQIAKAKVLIDKFADSDFRGSAFYVMAAASDLKRDSDNVVVYGEQSVAADPMNFGSMALMSKAIAQSTKKFDLDKADKLARADKLAKDALDLSKKAPKPNAELTDDQWAAAVKDIVEPAYEGLAFESLAKEDYAGCADNFKLAVTSMSQLEPALLVRGGHCSLMAKKYDDAIAAFDQAINAPNSVQVIKDVAGKEKAAAVQLKSKAAAQ
jgi:tetratricopeptide (TPR) repeat protein